MLNTARVIIPDCSSVYMFGRKVYGTVTVGSYETCYLFTDQAQKRKEVKEGAPVLSYYVTSLGTIVQVQCETGISFRPIPSLTRSHTKPRTKQLREEVILVKEDISLKDNSVSHCAYPRSI